MAPADWIGDHVVFSAKSDDITSLWQLAVSSSTGKATGLPRQLTSGTSLEAKPSAIFGGQIAFASLTHHLNIWGVPIDANRGQVTGPEQKLTHAANDAHTSLSADGKKLVFTSTRSGNPDVWMKNLTTNQETALTVTPGSEEQPEITGDGTRVCYMVAEGPKFAIYGVSANGDVPERLCADCGRPWDWSPDGSKILYLVAEGRGNQTRSPMSLAFFDIATRQKTAYLEHPQYNLARARFSPDGRWISAVAFTGRSSDRIVLIPFRSHPPPGEDQWISITDGTTVHEKPRWSPDGKPLVFLVRSRWVSLYSRSAPRPDDEAPERASLRCVSLPQRSALADERRHSVLELSLSRDRLVFNLGEITGNIWMVSPKGQR